VWRTSSYSGENGNCVAVKFPAAGPVAVRDSKNPDGPQLAFQASVWAGFVKRSKLLEDGEIPFDKRGRHRRVRVADVAAYRERARVERRSALTEMARLAVEDRSYDTVDGFAPTR
jgi:hypothetical protein